MPNRILQEHRAQYPEDARSDTAIMLDYARRYPDLPDQFPDFHNDLIAATKAAEPGGGMTDAELQAAFDKAYPPGVADYLKQASGELIRGAAGTLSSIPEAVGTAARIAGTYSVPGAAYVPMYNETQPGGLETSVRTLGEKLSPEPVPQLQKSFLAATVPQAIGSGAAFLLGGGAAGLAERAVLPALTEAGAGRLAAANIAGLGALSQAQQGYDEAKRAGADEHTRFVSFALNLPVGMTEAVPLANMLNRMDKLSGGTLKQALLHAATDSFEEAIQNSFQGVAGDVIAQRLARYEPDRKLFSSLKEDAASGGIAAAVLSLATSAIGAKLGRLQPAGAAEATPTPGPAAVPATPAAVDVAAQYDRVDLLQQLAQAEAGGGLTAENQRAMAGLTPSEQLRYPGILQQSKLEVQRASTAIPIEEGVLGQRVGTAPQLPPEGGNRTAEELVAQESPPSSTGDSLQGPAGEPITTSAADAPPAPTERTNTANVLAIGQDFAERLAQLRALTPAQQMRLGIIRAILRNPTSASAENLAAFFGLTLDETETRMPARYGFVAAPPVAQSPAVAVPVPPVVAPVPIQTRAEAAAQPPAVPTVTPAAAAAVPTDANAAIFPLRQSVKGTPWEDAQGRPVAVVNGKWTVVSTPTTQALAVSAGRPTLDYLGRLLRSEAKRVLSESEGTAILIDAENAGRTPDQIIREFFTTAWPSFSGDQRNRLERFFAASTGMTPAELNEGWESIITNSVQSNTIEQLQGTDRGLIAVLEFGNEAFRNAKARLPSPRALAATLAVSAPVAQRTIPAPVQEQGNHPVLDQIDFEGDSPLVFQQSAQGTKGETATLAPAYFEVKDPASVQTQAGARDAGLVSRASVSGEVDHGSRNTWTHRWTAFRNGNRVFLAPTYVGDDGVIRAALPGRKQGTKIEALAKQGYVAVASFRSRDAVHATETAKPILGASEFERRVAAPSRERMSAMARTAAAVRSAMPPTEAVTPVEPGVKPGAPEASNVIMPSELLVSKALADDLYPALTAALAQQPEGRLGIDSAENALVDYVEKGKHADEIKELVRDIAGRVGASAAARLVVGRIVQAYNDSATGEAFAAAVSERTAVGAGAQGGSGGQTGIAGAGLEQRPAKPAVPAGPAPENRGVAGQRVSWLRLASEPGTSYTRSEHILARYEALLSRLAVAGVEVNVFESHLGAVFNEFFNRPGAGFQNGNAITLIVSELGNPTNLEYETAVHEAAHWLFKDESKETQARLQRAINRIGHAQLGLEESTDARIRNQRIPDPEARAQEYLAESLALDGFDPISARTWSQRIMRFLKDLWLRASLAVQQAFLGADHVNPERVLEYYRNRLQSFLAGDPRPKDFVSFLGGGKPSLFRQATFFKPWNDSFVPVTLDWENGRIEYQRFVSGTVAAVLFNTDNALRETSGLYRQPGYVSDIAQPVAGENATITAGWTVAAAKKVDEILGKAFQAFDSTEHNRTATGEQLLTEAAFVELFRGDLDTPQDIVAGQQYKLQQTNQAPVNPDLSIDGPVSFNNDATRQQARAMALKQVNAWLSNANKAQAEAVSSQKSIERRLNRQLDRSEQMALKYQDLGFHFENVKEAITDLVAELKDDIRMQVRESRRLGMLGQMIKQTQARIEDPIPPQYEKLIDRMAKRIFTNADGFMDFLRATAALDINWQGLPLPQLRQLVGLRAQMEQNQVFHGMNEQEQNILLALAASFAKSNDFQMAWLRVKETNDHEAATAIREMLNEARKDTTADLNNAQKLVNRVPRLAVQAQTILKRYIQARKEARTLIDQQRAGRTLIAAHAAAAPIMQQEIGRLETALAGTKPAALIEGARLPYVTTPEDTVDMLRKNTFEYHATGENAATPQQIGRLIERYRAWIDRNGETGGAMAATLRDLVRRLEMVDAGKKQVGIRQTWLARAFNSLSDAARNTGTIAGARIGQMLTHYSYLTGSKYLKELSKAGERVEAAQGRAMKAMGITDIEFFYENFQQQAFDFLNKHKDLQETAGGKEQVRLAARSAMRNFFLANPALAPYVRNNESWAKYWNYITATADDYAPKLVEYNKAMGNKIQDDNLGLYRDPIGDPLFTMPRGIHENLERLYHDMRAAWDGTGSPRLRAAEASRSFAEDPDKFRQSVAQRFVSKVWETFVKPMTDRPVRSLFSGKLLPDGSYTLANVENVKQAYNDARGDAMVFAARLHQLEGNDPHTLPAFIGETLETFQNYYNAVEGIFADTEDAAQRFGMNIGVPRFLMDARVSEDFPQEWLRYQRFDQNHARLAVHRMAFHAAFGRNGSTVAADFGAAERELSTANHKWNLLLAEAKNLKPDASRSQLNEAAAAKAKASGADPKFLQYAAESLRTLKKTEGQFEAWFKTSWSDMVEAKVFLEGLSFVTGLMVQGPKTAMINTMDVFGGPVLKYGLNTHSLRQIRYNWSKFANSVFGTLLDTVGYTLHTNSENMLRLRETGYNDPDIQRKLADRFVAEMNAPIAAGPVAGRFVKGARIARLFVQTGLPQRSQEPLYSTFKPQAPFTQISRWMNEALIQGDWFQYEGLISRARDYMRAHPDAISDPAFKFTADMLGYPKGYIFDSSQFFRAITASLERWGMTLEGLARSAAKDGAPLLTNEQFGRLARMSLDETSLESSIVTTPRWGGGEVARFAMPLLRWSFAKTEQIRKSFREPGGEWKMHALTEGLKALAIVVPVGLAYALLMDKYDQEVTGKKSNIRGFGQDNNWLAAIEQTARMGSLGLWGDLANTVGNYAGQGDLRGISVDNRVVFMNSFLNMLSAFTTAAKQGTATYATVYRPVLQSLGGSGYLQYAQIINNLLSLDTAESRVTARINVNNWLRAAGRELNLGVRIGRGTGPQAQPTEATPWLSEMLLAALADDQAGFMEAHNRAMAAARDEKKPDPEKYVRLAFAAYNPLRTVFSPPPTEFEYRQILARLPESGREAVQSGILLFNKFATQIGAREYEGSVEKAKPIPTTQPRFRGGPPTAEQIRSRAAASLYF